MASMLRLSGFPGWVVLVCVVSALVLAWHLWMYQTRRQSSSETQQILNDHIEERQRIEDTLRRTLTMFQLLQDVTAAAGTARRFEEALQNTLDIISAYTGWPVAHAFLPGTNDEGAEVLKPCGLWHLENPRDFEGFLRTGERKPLLRGKGLPGKAWSSRKVHWARFTTNPHSALFFRRALEVGLTTGFAIPVFHEENLLAVLEFFSTPAPDPDSTVLNALSGVGEQLGRVAERLQAEEEVEKLNQRLVELNDEKNQFLAIASHDLKNPLNAIGLTGQLLATGELTPDEVIEMGQRISNESQRATLLIQKLLDVNAIESGRFNLHLGEVSLGDALMHIQSKFQSRAEAKGHTIKLEFGGIDVLVWADPDYLQEVLDNLVSNALKFMAPGPPTKAVTLSISRVEGKGLLEVQDEGPGFSTEDMARAFGRFSKLSARPTGGESSTGLGLSIVKKLMEAMHGRVSLESQQGRGATFKITLPLAPVPESAP